MYVEYHKQIKNKKPLFTIFIKYIFVSICSYTWYARVHPHTMLVSYTICTFNSTTFHWFANWYGKRDLQNSRYLSILFIKDLVRLWLLQNWMLKTSLYWIVASNFTCSQIYLIQAPLHWSCQSPKHKTKHSPFEAFHLPLTVRPHKNRFNEFYCTHSSSWPLRMRSTRCYILENIFCMKSPECLHDEVHKHPQ